MKKTSIIFIFAIYLFAISCKKATLDSIKEIQKRVNISEVIDSTGIDTVETLTIEIDLSNNDGSRCRRIGEIKKSLHQSFPYSEIKLCNIKVNNGKPQITYEGELGFSRTGQNGEVMVEIPKLYFLRRIFESREYISISDKKLKGYQIDPAFIENGQEINHIYIGAYQGYLSNNKLHSFSNRKPTSHLSIENYRKAARNNGDGFGLFDARSLFLIQRLYMIYFADRNSQGTLGMGLTNFFWQTQASTTAILSEEQTNKIVVDVSNHNDRYFKINQNIAIAPNGEYSLNQTRTISDIISLGNGKLEVYFTGEKVNIISERSKIYGQVQKTGLTDVIGSFNGNSAYFGGSSTNGTESVKFIHIENLWGNVWTMIDGLFIKNLDPYFGSNMSDYDNPNPESVFLKLKYKVPLQDQNKQNKAEESYAYVSQLGYDKEFPGLAIPSKIGQTASPISGYSDPFYSKNDNNVIYYAAHGGGFDHSIRAGLFTLRIWWEKSQSNSNLHGARIQFKYLHNFL
ncbi:hypothetical protein [Sphingobacterium hotanense]|uniref:hypothetical protein n=1 Tax=Sphingobacterium hotanense TaxID=649196 RepID=UPI0021A382EE|nr:hypothetical protein [Sphingobacterium hotanense]MCT1523538.1 hypothetical protein [Sphingobacterium hotanense]